MCIRDRAYTDQSKDTSVTLVQASKNTSAAMEKPEGDDIFEINKHPNGSHSKARVLTDGSMVSDEGEWTRTLLDEPVINLIPEDGLDLDRSSIPPSSLTYNYQEQFFMNEDLELSKDITISNPFMITKMKSNSKKRNISGENFNSIKLTTGLKNKKDLETKESKNKSTLSQRPLNFNVGNSSFSKVHQKSEIPQNKNENIIMEPMQIFIEDESERANISRDEPQEKKAKVKISLNSQASNHNRKSGRHLSMFSEYTNSFTTSITFHGLRTAFDDVAVETAWKQRTGEPSSILKEKLKSISESIGKPYSCLLYTSRCV